MMRVACVLLLLVLSLSALADDSPDALMARLHDALLRDDPGLLPALVVQPESEPRALEDLRELIDYNDCITLGRFDWSVVTEAEDSARVRLDVHGFVFTKSEPRTRVDLPRFFHLDLQRGEDGWKIRRMHSAERRLGGQMARAASFADAECMFFADEEADPLRALVEYSDWLGGGRDAAVSTHARAFAEPLGTTFVRIFTKRVEATIHGEALRTESVAMADEALAMARAEGSTDDVADALFTAGIVRYLLGDNAGAAPLLRASGALVHETSDPILSIKAEHMAGYVHRTRGEMLQALQCTQRVEEASRQYGWREGEEVATFSMADLHFSLRNYELALAEAMRARDLAERYAHPEFLFYAWSDIAGALEKLGRVDEAIEHYQKAMGVTPLNHVPAELATRVAELHLQRGALEKAEAALAEAETLQKREDVDGRRMQIQLLRARAELRLRQNRVQEALADLDRAGAVRGADDDVREIAERIRTSFTLGRALRAAGRAEEAIEMLRRGIEATESRRALLAIDLGRINFFEESIDGYKELVELLVERGRTREAFRVAEQMKGRTLRDVLARGHIDLSASMTAEERRREEELEANLVAVNRELTATPSDELRARQEAARRELEMFRAAMRLRHPSVERRRVDALERLELPDRSMAVVQYVVGEKKTTVFCLVDDALEVFTIAIGREQLEGEAEAFTRAVASRSMRYAEPARQLYGRLLQPLEPLIAKKELLCIIPDGALWNVPFQALMPRAATHLVDEHAVFYAQSLSLLNHAFARASVDEPRLLAFGNPTVGTVARSTFRDVQLGALPDAEDEVRELSSFYEPTRRRAYWREAARESVFKAEAEQYDVIHVAAHAIVDNAAPMYSAIVLASANDEREDGLLEAREVVDLDLDANLAVLSACDTARGKVGAGEGVIGIAWAFFAAGCPTTVVSQWKAESRATSRLMVELHRRLTAGDTTAEALRVAQRKLRASREWSHPFYWAPFVAVGAAGKSM